MDAAKLMWLMYEHPEARFEDLALRFMDIRKRIVEFPKLGEKAVFVAIPTTSGTGSEVTPFAVITDDATGRKTRSPITRSRRRWRSWTRSWSRACPAVSRPPAG